MKTPKPLVILMLGMVCAGRLPAQTAVATTSHMLGPVAGYRTQSGTQQPIQSAITDAQAEQIFNSTVGSQSLSSIPLIGMAQYLIYEILPPWASSTTIPGTYDPPIDNPFYNTILAQLVRGCETSSGEVAPSENQAVAADKSATQKSMAIQDIEDKVNKALTKADDQSRSDTIQKEMTTSFGDNSFKLSLDVVAKPTDQVALTVTNGDALTQAAMINAVNARKVSASISDQQAKYYSSMTGASNTINDYARLANAQQVTKAQALQAISTVANERNELRAIARQEEAQAIQEQHKVEQAAVSIR